MVANGRKRSQMVVISWSHWCSWSFFSFFSVYFSRLLWSVMFQLIPLMFMELFQFAPCMFFSFILLCYVSVDPANVHGAVSVCSLYFFLVYCALLCFSWSRWCSWSCFSLLRVCLDCSRPVFVLQLWGTYVFYNQISSNCWGQYMRWL